MTQASVARLLLVTILAIQAFALVQGTILTPDELLQVFIYTDRPAYRPGATVNVNMLVNKPASAILTVNPPSFDS
jgi:uncharacterized protein YfaS (alpha-2-macroglobulin family)